MAVDDAAVAAEAQAQPAAADSHPRSDAAAPKLRRWPAVIMAASVVCAALAYAWLGSGVEPRLSATSAAGPAHARSEPPPGTASNPLQTLPPAVPAGASASAGPVMPPAERESAAARHDTVTRRLAVRRESATVRRAPAAVSDTDHAGGADRGATVAPIAANAPGALQANVASPGDRWQTLNEALANCGGNFIERIVCGQRARFRYCDGYWGRVPQCPSGAVADNR